ncbi:hypothetical protein [ANMV-1 virus]|nr:hypothetical protein [ANMV-1 virus]
MTLKGSDNVTITLARTTVAMLRAKKEDLETWDELMLKLGRRQCLEITCAFCGAIIGTGDTNTTLDMLANLNGWDIVYSSREAVLGYMCPACAELHGSAK